MLPSGLLTWDGVNRGLCGHVHPSPGHAEKVQKQGKRPSEGERLREGVETPMTSPWSLDPARGCPGPTGTCLSGLSWFGSCFCPLQWKVLSSRAFQWVPYFLRILPFTKPLHGRAQISAKHEVLDGKDISLRSFTLEVMGQPSLE